ncbi:TonB-dependent receptor [Tenacibaculum aiptasiae]|uniref:TonB-dependent receptor n=1 Tax=Tenacibaculum aiptasiae TaxID=426481 RepID=A0A7J5ACD2_9FLAO|nr:TonB-dependent receptor [Tenacibaculum aiptasiae]KAB1155236.1 TonB-dependent receptor [Tenacibaculum aiptasiae]
MKKLLLVSICLLSLWGYAQDKSSLKGRILDESNLPLPGATIVIPSLKIGISSNFNGYYELLNIPEGNHLISISFIGYQTIEETVSIQNGVLIKNFSLAPKMNKLEEVIIKGSIGKGQAKALNQQKNKANITNIISADQVGKFPDANIGDALKRVPGISMQNDQGEARDIIIRGLAPQLNSVTLNGDRIPSAEGDNRRVQMDLIPSDMIQTIEVNKAVTPDMEGDAIGGSVNLITRSAPSTFRAFLTGSYGRNPVRNSPNYNFSALVADRIFNKKLGYVINTSYNSNDYGSDNVEFEWEQENNKTYIGEHDIRRYDVKRNRMSVAVNLDWNASSNNTFFFKSMYNQRNDFENRYRLRFRKIDQPNAAGISKAEVRRQTKGGINNNTNDNTRLEKQSVYKLSLGGEHLIFGNIKLDWKTGISKAKEERPNERYIRFENDDIEVTQDFSRAKFPSLIPTNNDFNDPSKFVYDEVTQERRFTQERKISSNFNILIPINATGTYKNSLKFGFKHKYKEKLRDNNFFEYDLESQIPTMNATITADYTVNGFLAGNNYKSGLFTSKEFLGSLILANGEAVLDEFVPENYDANENIYAFYGMLQQKLGQKFSIIAGLRAEKTTIDYNGFAIDVETAQTIDDATRTSGSKNYTNWLPNFHAKYKVNKNTILRAAWTNTIARPNYFDLVPYRNINSDDIEAEYGNPDLNPTESMNLDLMFEHYFSNVGIISAGVFYKDIDKFIYNSISKESITINGTTDVYDVTRPFNGGTAEIYGFEIALQRKLNFLPSFLRNLTVYGNYTFTDSKTDGIADRNDGLPLAGAVKNMFNASLAYETSKLSVRTSLNFADDYISEYGKDTFTDVFYDQQLFLDVNAAYNITKKLRVFAEAKNLTNQELRFYQGTKNQTRQAEFYNYNWNIGLKYNF